MPTHWKIPYFYRPRWFTSPCFVCVIDPDSMSSQLFSYFCLFHLWDWNKYFRSDIPPCDYFILSFSSVSFAYGCESAESNVHSSVCFFLLFFLTLITLDLSLSLSIKSVYPAEILLQLSGFWETVKWREIKWLTLRDGRRLTFQVESFSDRAGVDDSATTDKCDRDWKWNPL